MQMFHAYTGFSRVTALKRFKKTCTRAKNRAISIGFHDAAAANRKVCIIDSGYDRNHEDLSANNVTGEYDAGTGWWYTDENHHGTHVAGTAMKTQLGQSATVGVKASNYAYFDGTSMATPHVSAVAALVWSYFPTCTAKQIRATLGKSALDLGTAGRDTKYGFGLVQAKAAHDRIKSLGCGM
jgi:subtilisin family serine protease